MALVRVVLGDFGVRERGRGAPHTHTLTSRSPLRALSQIPQTPRRMPNLVERPSQSMQVLTTAPRFPTGEISRRFPIRPWLPPPPSPTPPLPLAPWRCHSLSCSAAKGPDRCWQGSGWGGAHHCRGADEGGNQSSSSEPITAEDQMREAIRAHHQSSSSELIRAHQSTSLPRMRRGQREQEQDRTMSPSATHSSCWAFRPLYSFWPSQVSTLCGEARNKGSSEAPYTGGRQAHGRLAG